MPGDGHVGVQAGSSKGKKSVKDLSRISSAGSLNSQGSRPGSGRNSPGAAAGDWEKRINASFSVWAAESLDKVHHSQITDHRCSVVLYLYIPIHISFDI